MTTKITSRRISGAAVNVLDYMTAAQKADVLAGTGSVDVTAAIQAAVDAASCVYFPSGTYLTGKITLNQGSRLVGANVFDVKLLGSAATILEYDNAGGFTGSLQVHIENITFRGQTEDTTTALRGASDTVYIAYTTVKNCQFWADLKYGIYGNFIQGFFDNCTFGYFGSATTAMTNAVYLNGQSGTEANANTFHNCYIANTSAEGMYLSTGWGNNIVNTVIEVTGREAIWIDGGLQTSLTNVYIERCYDGHTPVGNECMIRTSNNATTSDSVFGININGGLFQSSAGIAGGYFIRSDGSCVINVRGASFGSLATHAISLSTSNDKISFDGTNYYPGGFTGFSAPRITVVNQGDVQTFNEIDASTGAAVSKRIRRSDASDGGTALRLESARTESSAYYFDSCFADYDGTPALQHYRRGNGELYNKRNHIIGSTGDWDDGHLVLGTFHIWVDNTGDLRIKNGAPTSTTDGTLIGTQT